MGLTSLLKEWYNTGNATSVARQALEEATTYEEYKAAAQLLDFLEGRNVFKAEPFSQDYDSSLLSARIIQLKDARQAGDFHKIQFLLRTSLSRNLGNMGNANLYSKTHIGTKYLIENYISEVERALHFLLSKTKEMSEQDAQSVLSSLLKARQAFGRTALLLSGGGTLGMMHIGVIKTLFEAQLLPRIISGSSAGAIVAAIVCTRKDEELSELVTQFPYGNLQVFQYNDRPESVFTRLGRFLKHGVFMDIHFLSDVMVEWMGNMTFGEAFNKTRRILNITVSSSSIYEMPRLLNYITAPNVIIWSAVSASCSIPGIFSGSPLMAKSQATGQPVPWNSAGNKSIDGSIEGDLPTTRLSELFNVNHFIVSQVNPHVTLFLPTESHELENTTGLFSTMLMNEVLHYTEVLTALSVAPALFTRLTAILKQRYIGHITILPQVPMARGLLKLLSNPTPEFMIDASARGERAAWKRMSLIRNHLQIETTIDNTLYQLRLAVMQQNRPTRYLKASRSTHNLDTEQHGRFRSRRRSSSIVSNTSVELDPSDVAPTIDPKGRSRSSTPKFERSGFSWDATFPTARKDTASPAPVIRKTRRPRRASRRASIDLSHLDVGERVAHASSERSGLEQLGPSQLETLERLEKYGYSRPQSPLSRSRSPRVLKISH